jgi:hypothetical protein
MAAASRAGRRVKRALVVSELCRADHSLMSGPSFALDRAAGRPGRIRHASAHDRSSASEHAVTVSSQGSVQEIERDRGGARSAGESRGWRRSRIWGVGRFAREAMARRRTVIPTCGRDAGLFRRPRTATVARGVHAGRRCRWSLVAIVSLDCQAYLATSTRSGRIGNGGGKDPAWKRSAS